jgi:uncharacterized protein involved in response to NO
MLWGFIATIAAGFLLTAGATWTGLNPLRGPALGLACALWGLARVGFLVGGTGWFVAAAVAEVAFFAAAAAAMARVVLRSRNRRNYAVPLLLLGLAANDALFLLAAWQGDHALLMQRFRAAMLVMALIALLIARRVIPFFAMRAVAGLKIPLHGRSGQVQLAACALALVAMLAGWSSLLAVGLAAAGTLALVQVVAWRPWAVRHKPLLSILYAGHAGLGLGLLVAAAQAAGLAVRDAVPVHIIAMAGFSVLIIGMVTRTALGHLGRALVLDRSMLLSYGLPAGSMALPSPAQGAGVAQALTVGVFQSADVNGSSWPDRAPRRSSQSGQSPEGGLRGDELSVESRCGAVADHPGPHVQNRRTSRHSPISTTVRHRRNARFGGFRPRRSREPVQAGTVGSARGFARCAVSLHRLQPRQWRERR